LRHGFDSAAGLDHASNRRPDVSTSRSTAVREIVMMASMLKQSLMWVIGIGAVLFILALCLNLELLPVRPAY
jgi:hypothetical protein